MKNKDQTNVYATGTAEEYHRIAAALGPGEPVVSLLRKIAPNHLQGEVLDLGAGTGVLSLALSNAGSEVTALDADEEMLHFLRVDDAPGACKTILADFRNFDLGRRFRLITMSRNTFYMAQTTEDKLSVLKGIRAHLHEDGVALLDCSDATKFIALGKGLSSFSLPLSRNMSLTVTQSVDTAAQMVSTLYTTYTSGGPSSFQELATWSTLAELRWMAAMVGLEVRGVFADYEANDYCNFSEGMIALLGPSLDEGIETSVDLQMKSKF